MKHVGCSIDFTSIRDKELMLAFRRVINEVDYIEMDYVFDKVVNTPCSRFWVSEERATAVISNMLRGNPILSTMRDTKKEMFTEIYNRVLLLKKEQKEDLPLFDIVFSVVNSPAPKFYMMPRYAMNIVYRIKNGKNKSSNESSIIS